jgi:hypothetical protein
MMQAGWRAASGSRAGSLGNEGEWWLANQSLNRINNKVQNVGESDAWGVPRLPWAKPVYADAKNTQRIPGLSGTNG